VSKSQVCEVTPVAGAKAGLFFLQGQYAFRWIQEGAERTKLVSPASVRGAFSKEPIDSGWLPEGVLRCGNGSRGVWMVKWYPPAIYRLTIDNDGKLKRIKAPMPSLIWFGQKTHYYLWAAKEAKPKPNAALYRVPVPNVDHHGLICFGNNAHPDVAAGGFEKTWKMFWDAPFSEHHDNGKSKTHKEGIIDKLTGLGRLTRYPVGDLVSAGVTFEQAIARLTRRDRNDFDGY